MAIEDQQEEKDITRRHWLEHQHLHCLLQTFINLEGHHDRAQPN